MEEPVTLRCGGSNTKSSQFERRQLCAVSSYLAPKLAQRQTHKVTICDTSDEVLGLFCIWVQDTNTVVDSKCLSYMQEPWLSSTAAAWILGQTIKAEGFQKFCMGIFIKNCALCPFGPWKETEKHAEDRSPLRRFSNHWIAWNVSLLEHPPPEYEGLRAVALAKYVTHDIVNPRGFDQDHWYSDCGERISPLCKHNPRTEEQREEKMEAPQETMAVNGCDNKQEVTRPAEPLAKPKKSHRKPRTRDSHESLRVNRPQRRPILSHRSSRQTIRSASPGPSVLSSWYYRRITIRQQDIYRWTSILLFTTCLCNNLAFCIEILVHSYAGVNILIICYNTICVALGVYCEFIPQAVPWYWLCATVDGVVMVINTASCCEVAGASVCSRMGAFTAFVWLSIPVPLGYWFIWKRYWYRTSS